MINSARHNHWVIDSPTALGGPNQEVNPLDSLLGALSTCGIFIYEKAAQELNIPLDHISAVAEGDFAAQGMKDGSVNPRIRAFRVKFKLSGPSVAQANQLRSQFKKRCPVYTTLSLAAPIDVIHVGMDDKVGVLLEVNFKFKVPPTELQAALSPLAIVYVSGADPRLTGAAGRSVLAHLYDLKARRIVAEEGETWRLIS